MATGDLNWIANFIWGIADDVLRDVYVRGKYRDVILPMVVIRRLDAILEPTKEAVLRMKENLDAAKVANQHAALCQASGEAFYNTSKFTLRDLKARAKQQQLEADFEAYLDGFSPNVQEILDKFKFRNQIQTLVDGRHHTATRRTRRSPHRSKELGKSAQPGRCNRFDSESRPVDC